MRSLVYLFDLLLLHIVLLACTGPGILLCFHLRWFPPHSDEWNIHPCQCLKTFFLIPTSGRVVGGDPTSRWRVQTRDTPTQGIIQPQMLTVPRLRHPHLLTSKMSLCFKTFTFTLIIYPDSSWYTFSFIVKGPYHCLSLIDDGGRELSSLGHHSFLYDTPRVVWLLLCIWRLFSSICKTQPNL